MTRRIRRALTSRDSIVAIATFALAMFVLADQRLAIAAILVAGAIVFREPPGLIHSVSKLHLDPGDKILLEVKGHVPAKRMHEMAETLRRLFPDNHILLVGKGVTISRHVPPAPRRCTCDITERSLCIVHGTTPIHIEADPGAVHAADRIIGPGYNSILLVPDRVPHWPTLAHQDADFVLTDEMVIKDRNGPAPRPVSSQESDFLIAFGRPDQAVLIQRVRSSAAA